MAGRPRQRRSRRARSDGPARHHRADPGQHREGHRGQAGGRPAGPGRPARRGAPAHRGRPRGRQDAAREGAGALGRLLGAAHPVHAGPAAQRRHRGVGLRPGARATSSSSPARSSPTWWSATRSTGPRPRPSPRCSRPWRSGRSPSTAPPTPLETPFMVVATQNPIEMEGTYPLPEAQRDRFTARLSMGYPSPAAELEMLATHGGHDPLDDLEPVADALEVRKLLEVVRGIARRGRRQALRRRPGHGHPPLPRPAARRVAARQPAAACGRPGRPRRWTDATTSCPTTCRRSPSRCWRTGCCSPPRPRCAAHARPTVVTDLLARVPVPATADERPAGRRWPGSRRAAAPGVLRGGARAGRGAARPAATCCASRSSCSSLPLVAVAVVSRTRYRLTCERSLDPVRVEVGPAHRGAAEAGQRQPAADRCAADGGRPPVRAGRAAAVRPGPGRAARACAT